MSATKITLLRSVEARLSKKWLPDGTIEDYGGGKFFIPESRQLDGIQSLSKLLTDLEGEPLGCVIRGEFRGYEHARSLDVELKGKPDSWVRRTLDTFSDTPRHWVLIEIDDFEPMIYDPVTEVEGAIDEYLCLYLREFWMRSFHWQLSNSAGHASKANKLKAHLWFWLDQPADCGQLNAWAETKRVDGQIPFDTAVFRTVQVHYTAGPSFAPGVVDPVPVRSGFVRGLLDDTVSIKFPIGPSAAKPGRVERITAQAEADPVARALHERGMVKGVGRHGELMIECPRAEHHTGEGGPSSTVYYLAHTGGHAKPRFHCLHAHCKSMPQGEFIKAMGLDPMDIALAALDAPPPASTIPGVAELFAASGIAVKPEGSVEARAARIKAVPDGHHLCTDQANAARLEKYFGTQMIVVGEQWYAWSGKHWASDEGRVYQLAMTLSAVIHREADEIEARPASRNAEEMAERAALVDALRQWAKRSEMKGTIEAAIGLARKLRQVESDLLDSDPYLLNVANGTVDLRTGALRSHNPTDYITQCIDLEYDPRNTAPEWEALIRRVCLEQDTMQPGWVAPRNNELSGFLRRWFGYCATGSTKEQVFCVMHGGGRNGKSTVIEAVADVLGGYATTAAPNLMSGSDGNRHPTEVANLFGRRMVTAHENDDGAVLREGFVKQATGSDRIKARFMRQDFFEFAPTHKLQLLTNYKPTIRGQDEGIWRRVLLVPWKARFGTPEEVASGRATYVKDKSIVERILREREGILAWLIRGAGEWYRDGLQPPAAVRNASNAYQNDQDRMAQFIDEECVLAQGAQCPAKAAIGGLYNTYTVWCKDAGYNPLGFRRFKDEIVRAAGARGTAINFEQQQFSGVGGRARRELVAHNIRLAGSD